MGADRIAELEKELKERDAQIIELAKDKAALMEENNSLKFRIETLEKAFG